MFDPIQAPPLRHAIELVSAVIPEADFGLRHPILDRARDEDFAGTRCRGLPGQPLSFSQRPPRRLQ
jgi:hypothetical protein